MEDSHQNKTVKRGPAGIFFIGAAVFFMVVGILAGNRFRLEAISHKDARKFEEALHKKERVLKGELEQLEILFADGSPTEVLDKKSSNYQKLASMDGISIFYYEKGILKYWSDHSIPLPNRWRARFERPFVSLRNADYVSVVRRLDKGRLVGLIEIRTHFPFQNDFLINGYQHDFALDPGVGIEILEANGSEPIYNEDGDYLFSLDLGDTMSVDRALKTIAVSSLLLFLLLTFVGINRLTREAKGRVKWLWTGIITAIIGGFTWAVLKVSFPSMLTGSELFQPELFASHLFPSLGSVLVISLAAILLITFYYLHVNLEGIRSHRIRQALSILLFVGAAVLLLMIEHLISILVLDSSISFEAYRVTTFTGYTLIGLSVIIMWFVVLVLMIDKAILLLSGSLFQALLIGFLAISATILVAVLLPGQFGSWISWIGMMYFWQGTFI